MNVTGADIRKVREQLGEDQTVFGTRFDVHRRTVIRWEKGGHSFMSWGGWNRPDGKSEFDLWRATVALAESSRVESSAAKAAKKNSARRRKRAAKAVTVKRRRGSVARRRSAAKAKKKSRTRRARR
jgi:flagellar biosynthesis GTPase FlhF